MMTGRKEGIRRWFRKPVERIIRSLPERLTHRLVAGIKRKMEGQYAETAQQTEERAEEFLIKEGMLLFWGMLVLLVMAGSLVVFRMAEPSALVFERNSFGEGEKEVSFILQKGEQEREYSLILGEQQLSEEEEKTLKKTFFDELEEQMAGDNASLRKVNQKLCLEDVLPGWPFHITYDTKNSGYIYLDGSLGEESATLKNGETAEEEITVTAEYGSYLWKKTVALRLIPQEKEESRSPFAHVIRSLKKTEAETRKERIYTIDSRTEDVRIYQEEDFSPPGLLLFGSILLVLIVMRNVSELRNGEKVCQRETQRDFPVIVHLLTLYMGAGLSFPSAIHRISVDYSSRQDGGRKYAFEEILRMDTRLMLGEGQEEVCMQWGRRFREPAYQKLSLTLLQVMEKGTREGRTLMEHMERESFRQRLDQAKTEGEEASTKLLFPMIVLLGMVMLLVMFPAIVRFQGL